MAILATSAGLALLLARGRERRTFSVFAGDVQLGSSDGPQGFSGHPAARSNALFTRNPEAHGSLLSRFAALVTLPLADLINAVFPADCQVCGGPLLRPSRVPVCDRCEERLAPIPASAVLCSRCGDALGPESLRFAAAHRITECTACRLAPPEFTRAAAFAAYDDSTRELLQMLKFRGMAPVAKHLLADGMAQAMRELLPHLAVDALVLPVPLYAARERSRGFNQAALLARSGLHRLRRFEPGCRLALCTGALERVRDTRDSHALDPHSRRENLRGAFRVPEAGLLRGRDVLLVDDILTTGATARECARVLLRAGAVRVCVATFARTFAEGVTLGDQIAPWGEPVESALAQRKEMSKEDPGIRNQ